MPSSWGSTSASLDAAIWVTFPGTRSEPAPDVGQGGARACALYLARQDALDQFFCRHPDEFLERLVEAAILDHENEQIQLQS